MSSPSDTSTPTHPREDARRNRAAILNAARALFAESSDVPMCEIARRAGVGQATLYRNFPNRSTLAAEVLGEHVDRIALLAAQHEADPDAFFVLLRALVETVAQTHALSELAREDACVGSRLELERQRVAELVRGPLCNAKSAGALRRDATVDDIFLILLMARGAMESLPSAPARAAAAHRVLTLALDGLVPAGTRT
jgi:AcrR family transcriptional regulator